MKHVYLVSCADPESFQRDLTKYFFLFWLIREERIQLLLKLNYHLMAIRWRADDGPTLIAGLVALCFSRGSGPVLLKNLIAQ